ncbi:LysR family transcriptional regulator [Leisingera sp. ANG59]|uniref:LysR family transcriptional regulator n=1 Tax=Leisingera sp. ANG59 TaxID=2675221 RepID=UPI001C2D52EA|nr:LysR family transcriptional regulator [Leisingera sp. ANG59]
MSPETLQAFVLAAELGSFSAAARRMGKAQSAISTAIANLEIDCGLQLFDRSGRSPVLTRAGQEMLPHARGILLGQREFAAKAASMAEGVEDSLCLAVEQGLNMAPLLEALGGFAEAYPHVALEILSAGPNDTAALLKEGRADLGLMTEQEFYPEGFQFRGVGHMAVVPVCGRGHPLAALGPLAHRDLRAHRQLVLRSRARDAKWQIGEPHSAMVWCAESPGVIIELLRQRLGWAELPLPAVQPHLDSGALVRLCYGFQQSDALAGIDVVWTSQRVLGQAGQWLQQHLLKLPQEAWRC